MSDDKPPREKKSWREIDASRDRSGAKRAPPSGEGGGGKRADRASKQYRAALDALFDKGNKEGFQRVAEVLGKGEPAAKQAAAPADDEGRRALHQKVIAAIGRSEVSRALDRYLAKYPLPDDWELLEQALDHEDPARVEEALAKAEELLAREKPRRARTLIGKLRFLEEAGDRPELAARAAALRARLG
jgi:2-succinyl-5-enolpyruvyl-6-hydroxy-3-cyclohexene-1-carboxylate synthase